MAPFFSITIFPNTSNAFKGYVDSKKSHDGTLSDLNVTEAVWNHLDSDQNKRQPTSKLELWMSFKKPSKLKDDCSSRNEGWLKTKRCILCVFISFSCLFKERHIRDVTGSAVRETCSKVPSHLKLPDKYDLNYSHLSWHNILIRLHYLCYGKLQKSQVYDNTSVSPITSLQ